MTHSLMTPFGVKSLKTKLGGMRGKLENIYTSEKAETTLIKSRIDHLLHCSKETVGFIQEKFFLKREFSTF